ncbi:probable myosin-binding protein 5 [Camellia sinensis]|uniref:GTD-binding domain-containing protein n=1 Tax=Camellia sinensis var. sinensis TaxID=542762 RepID=A0A4S4D154_CAMSN|nr:probable myosin-binding protein 5 [Camellia sinensis]THF94805.1 hypothetical protein TEA_002605 [Camellia sinensis var. sinensis]
MNLKLIRDQNNCVDGFVEMEGEASCSSIPGARKLQNVVERDLILKNESVRVFDVVNSSVHVKNGRFELKGKGIANQRPRNSLRKVNHPMERQSNVQKELGYEGNEKNAIRILEQALEEEHGALYLELEKERSAAATAADEAMAMILRLQDEKASIEMEAWQYQRIIEEKSAYDAEEMNILKEILVRRQKEKHFLERVVEAYRQMIHIGN